MASIVTVTVTTILPDGTPHAVAHVVESTAAKVKDSIDRVCNITWSDAYRRDGYTGPKRFRRYISVRSHPVAAKTGRPVASDILSGLRHAIALDEERRAQNILDL